MDIIPLIWNDQISIQVENLKEQYSKGGYATTVKKYKSHYEADEELFKSFFSYDGTLSRLRKRYVDFTVKQSHSLIGINYEYISSPYEVHDINSEGNLIDFIYEKITDLSRTYLIIIEAAAGYGKTSTAFEILNSITNKNNSLVLPILTELSRNRGASIFRYILLDEIDKEHPSLNSELVIREIAKGRVPLIIDGFDELLDKVNLEADISSLDEIEPMLDTIGNLLNNKAKIVLTTRKTAIFNGYEFEQWKSKWNNQFEVIRIGIKEPSIEDWLGKQRCILLDNYNVPLHHLANPVLLSHLKSLTDDQFLVEILNSQLIVEKYFNRILEREKERQNLLISADSQRDIFRNVVRLMIDLDITSDKKEFIKELIRDENLKILEASRLAYPDKPTVDSLVDSLATHALLDRKGRDGNEIGFINDFVLGIFIGEIITENSYDPIVSNCSAYMFELAVTTYKVQSELARVNLWGKINKAKVKFGEYSLFIFDVILLNRISCDYNELTVKEISFVSTNFIANRISDSVFINYSFKRCHFDLSIFVGVSFINCEFISCTSTNDHQFQDFKSILIIRVVLI